MMEWLRLETGIHDEVGEGPTHTTGLRERWEQGRSLLFAFADESTSVEYEWAVVWLV